MGRLYTFFVEAILITSLMYFAYLALLDTDLIFIYWLHHIVGGVSLRQNQNTVNWVPR